MAGAPTLVFLTAMAFAVFAAALYSEYKRYIQERPHLTVTEFRIDRSPGTHFPIWVSGFPGLLSRFTGEGGEYVFRATRQDLTLENSSLGSMAVSFLPLRSAASTHCAYREPRRLLAAGSIVCVIALIEIALTALERGLDDYQRRAAYEALFRHVLACLSLATVAYAGYRAGKRVLVAIESRGGAHLGFAFRRRMSGGARVDFDQAIVLAEVLNNLVLDAATEHEKGVAVGHA